MGRSTKAASDVIENQIAGTADPDTTAEPEKETAEYKPGEDDAVYGDGTVVIGGKRKESVLIPKEPGTKIQIPVFAKANEATALIQRGKKVSVPRPLARVINESLKRNEAAEDYYYEKSN